VRVRDGLEAVLDDVREISRGVHPAISPTCGLEAALRALRRRSTVPVELEIDVPERLPQLIEVAAHYALHEALANVAKHARASFAALTVSAPIGACSLPCATTESAEPTPQRDPASPG
jgi:signal transduction histidine kinase